MNRESAYWITLAHDLTPFSFSNREGWKNEDKMNLVIRFFHDQKISIADFFNLPDEIWKTDYQLSDRQISDLKQAKEKLANNAFLSETLYNQGVETKGGTWSGAMDGLKKGRTVYVRKPEPSEKNDNLVLIQNGAVAVDFNGNAIMQKDNSKSLPSLFG